ncbi:MAG: 30S ribosomal protein S12 methylthiotransferase RimO [Peptococcaceae bacterium]|nr:30S ribosomal protein S12 methylthiotransferase RimO [Peptococcaceae bacterium]
MTGKIRKKEAEKREDMRVTENKTKPAVKPGPLIYLKTLGCPKNQVDSRQIAGMLAEAGYGFSEDPAGAEIILVNTCGFVDDAKEESINAILAMACFKKKGRCRFLAALGCLVQKYGRELEEALPEVDLFLGVTDWVQLLGFLDQSREPARELPKRLVVGPYDQHLYNNRWALGQKKEEHTGYLKIAEGCSHGCTYCVIPSIRGPYRSRPLAEILEEASLRAQRGMREAVIIAQDTGDYGRDLASGENLALLLEKLCQIPQLQWIRLMYCYPEAVTDHLIRAMKHPKVCPYVDMPIQHVSDKVLKRMARPITSGQLKEKIRRLRQEIPGISIRTTLMVGFPGEGEAEFQEMLDFLEEFKIERAGFFAFSPQPDTPAESFKDQVPEERKERRLEAAQALQARIMAEKETERIGRTLAVMVDRPLPEENAGRGRSLYEGRSLWDAPEIDGQVIFGGPPGILAGTIVPVEITHSQDYTLTGELTDESC